MHCGLHFWSGEVAVDLAAPMREWELLREWGGKGWRGRRSITLPASSYAKACALLDVTTMRRTRRGYQKNRGVMESQYDTHGHRKYLTKDERAAFLKAAERASRKVRTFCGTLAYTGCRISEALALTADCVDLTGGVIVFESLKKRKSGVYRAVPVPPALLDALDLVHNARQAQAKKDGGTSAHLGTWGRTWAWEQVKGVIQAAGLTDPASVTPKGLLHSFGITAVLNGVPLNLLKKWPGHAQRSTTAI